MKKREPIEERFARDIASHVMEIRHEEDLYRHVVFKRPETICMMFSLTTTPGRLIYAGDMGCFVFERLPDMFNFFRQREGHHKPDYGYWKQKLVACGDNEPTEKSVDRFRENLESFDIEDLTDEQKTEVAEFIDEVCSEYEDYGAECAYRKVHEFRLSDGSKNGSEFFVDFFEYSDSVLTLRYEWCCHAIQWGIAQYDNAKHAEACAVAEHNEPDPSGF